MEYLGRARSVDLVITDQAMPGMTGFKLVETIRQQWPHLPIILASGYADLPPLPEPDLITLSKPFRQDRLASTISESMKGEAMGKMIRFRPREG